MTHILRRRKYAMGETRNAEWPCAKCGMDRMERLEADDERGRLWCVLPCANAANHVRAA